MYDSECNYATGKENTSKKERNCIISMYLTSFKAYFVFGYACFVCICRKVLKIIL